MPDFLEDVWNYDDFVGSSEDNAVTDEDRKYDPESILECEEELNFD